MALTFANNNGDCFSPVGGDDWTFGGFGDDVDNDVEDDPSEGQAGLSQQPPVVPEMVVPLVKPQKKQHFDDLPEAGTVRASRTKVDTYYPFGPETSEDEGPKVRELS